MAKLLLKLFALQKGGEAVGGVAVPIWRHEAVAASWGRGLRQMAAALECCAGLLPRLLSGGGGAVGYGG